MPECFSSILLLCIFVSVLKKSKVEQEEIQVVPVVPNLGNQRIAVIQWKKFSGMG